MEHRHLWLRSPRQAAILRVRAEIIKAARDFFDDRGFTLTDPPILTPAACEGTTTLFPGRLLRRGGLPDAVRPALYRSHGHGARQGLQLRSDLPRREIENPPPPHRVLDGRAGSCLRHARRHYGSRRRLHHLHRQDVASKSVAPICQIVGRDIAKLEKIAAPFPRITYDEAVEMLAGRLRERRARKQVRMGRRPRLARRNLTCPRNSNAR